MERLQQINVINVMLIVLDHVQLKEQENVMEYVNLDGDIMIHLINVNNADPIVGHVILMEKENVISAMEDLD